ncbi:MAG: hypothetical protein ACLT98_10115 [Eggerthellaceae bacterium]
MVLQAIVSQQLVPTVDGGTAPAFEIMITNTAIRNLIRGEDASAGQRHRLGRCRGHARWIRACSIS